MKTIDVHASGSYTVTIDSCLLSRSGDYAAALVRGRHATLVSDTNIFPLHGQTVRASLILAGFLVDTFIIPAGEGSKSTENLIALAESCANVGLTRADLLVALGGGVVGDLTGLGAALYLRGLPFLQLPTTLLADVDSSVGGKTAVNLPQGKNLFGAFHQPAAVLCDTDALSTLPDRDFADGCAEVIKYAVLCGGELAALAEAGIRENLGDIIALCVAYKRDIVERDEFDRGERQLLNLGHTLGHAIEQASGYTVSHGRGVAAGLCMVSRAAARLGICAEETVRHAETLCRRYHLPTDSDFPDETLYNAALLDKKRGADRISLILPHAFGDCRVTPVDLPFLRRLISLSHEEGASR
ncbi:MAG: 3-dehydroquinate synthase [Clostridiaceae bacterium]|nr:3-dehydroquinate synthase [Clostridiaceae bacterium]